MTKNEFKKFYGRMAGMFGDRSVEHFNEWFLQFGKLSAKDFEQQVTQVISRFRPFGQDRWPTPGDFNFIVGGTQPLDVDYPDIPPGAGAL